MQARQRPETLSAYVPLGQDAWDTQAPLDVKKRLLLHCRQLAWLAPVQTAHPVEHDWQTWTLLAKNPGLQLDTQSLLFKTRGAEQEVHVAALVQVAQRDAQRAQVRSEEAVHAAVWYCDDKHEEHDWQVGFELLVHVPERKDPAAQVVVHEEHWRLEFDVHGDVWYVPVLHWVQDTHEGLEMLVHEPAKYVPVVQADDCVHGLHEVVDVAVHVPDRYWLPTQ